MKIFLRWEHKRHSHRIPCPTPHFNIPLPHAPDPMAIPQLFRSELCAVPSFNTRSLNLVASINTALPLIPTENFPTLQSTVKSKIPKYECHSSFYGIAGCSGFELEFILTHNLDLLNQFQHLSVHSSQLV
jgi:hypothetical protein